MHNDMILIKDLSITYNVRNVNSEKFFSSSFVCREILRSINLSIKEKGITAIIGKNGAGKTTLIKAMTGILYTKPGVVKIWGHNISDNRVKYLFGALFSQKSSLLQEHSLIENIKLTQAIYCISNSMQESINNYIKKSNLWGIKDRPIKTYSLGERIKAEIVNIFAFNPKILFLDEPTLGLDIESQKYLRQILNQYVADFDAHIILTSHNLQDIIQLADITYLLINGRLQQVESSGNYNQDILNLERVLS